MNRIASVILWICAAQLALGYEPQSNLPLSSSYVYRFLGVYSIFKAELYLPTDYNQTEIAKDKPLELQFTYYRSFTSDQLISSADKILESNPASLKKFANEINLINSAYRDVTEGDTYLLSYRPEVGTSLYLNGERLTTVPGDEFPQFYFSIWLGDHSKSAKISKALWAGIEDRQKRK